MTQAPVNPTTPLPLSPIELSRIAQDFQIRKIQVEHAIQLLDEGNSIPFIARYRRERTGGLFEFVIRRIHERVQQLRHFAERKKIVSKSIESQGKLTEELKTAIETADFPRRLEDLYLPYRPKKKSAAADPRDKGLEPLALAIWNRDEAVGNLDEVFAAMINPEKQLSTNDDIIKGVQLIQAEMISEMADVRGAARRFLWGTAKLTVSKNEKLAEGKGLDYKDYFQFSEPVQRVPAHRILAINRGERENALTGRLEFDAAALRNAILEVLPQLNDHPHRELLMPVVDTALAQFVVPALEREIRRELTDVAQHHAVEVFARNLHGLLMQPPLPAKRVLAVDPGFRTGCKLAALDENGGLLEDTVVFPHAPLKRIEEATLIIERMIRKHQPDVVAIGNGTACRETEELIAGLFTDLAAGKRGENAPPPAPPSAPSLSAVEITIVNEVPAPAEATRETSEGVTVTLPVVPEMATELSVPPPTESPDKPSPTPAPTPKPTQEEILVNLRETLKGLPEPPHDLVYVIVNEAGASDYSANPYGREEFPHLDAALRGTISIGRRLQDPLSELVKIDPQHIGIGLYQHDVHGKHLRGCLEAVIESCVNHVGVDLNTANIALLRHVAGLNQLVAREVFEYRQKHGPFKTRQQLAEVPAVGPARCFQAAGFLKITDGDEPLDATWIHPESYEIARQILQELGASPIDIRDSDKLKELREKFNSVNIEETSRKHQIAPQSVCDLLDALAHPGRDPRADLPPPIFRRDVLKLEDLQPGMELKGTVLNVVDFGAFVDIGLKDSGLVHISQLANRYIRNPHEIITVGDVVKVWVMSVDNERRRVSLTMIAPGTDRKLPEREVPAPRSFAPKGARLPQKREDRPPQQPRPDRGPRQGGRPPRHGDRGPRRQPVEAHAAGDVTAELNAPPPPRNLARLERKPQKPKPLPNLSREKREGKAYLNTLGELEAFFKARENEPPTAPPAD